MVPPVHWEKAMPIQINQSVVLFYKKWAILGLFFFNFVFSIQLIMIKTSPMTGFEQWTSGVGSDRFTNWATTTALINQSLQCSAKFWTLFVKLQCYALDNSVWPDLAKISRLWQYFKRSLGFLMLYLLFVKNLNLLWQMFYPNSQIYIVIISQIVKNNIAILSWASYFFVSCVPIKSFSNLVSAIIFIFWEQYDQIGLFLEVFGNKFSNKSSPNVWWLFWAILKNVICLVNLLWLLFGQLFQKFGQLFSPKSGYTAWESRRIMVGW